MQDTNNDSHIETQMKVVKINKELEKMHKVFRAYAILGTLAIAGLLILQSHRTGFLTSSLGVVTKLIGEVCKWLS